jgi:hypothetical protein
MENYKPIATPIVTNLIGSLMYLVKTRTNIFFL